MMFMGYKSAFTASPFLLPQCSCKHYPSTSCNTAPHAQTVKSGLKLQPVATCSMAESLTRLIRCVVGYVHVIIKRDVFTARRNLSDASS
jgi:hypothetical protein